MALGGYSIGSGILAALGRIEWGVSQALESRYVAFSLYLAVALGALGAIFCTALFQITAVIELAPAPLCSRIFCRRSLSYP